MSLAPLKDLRDPRTPTPVPADVHGRSSQIFAVDARVRRNGRTHRATVHGRDIYAVTAPLVVEAMQRILDGRSKASGVVAAGEAFDAEDFLESLPALRFAFSDALFEKRPRPTGAIQHVRISPHKKKARMSAPLSLFNQ